MTGQVAGGPITYRRINSKQQIKNPFFEKMFWHTAKTSENHFIRKITEKYALS